MNRREFLALSGFGALAVAAPLHAGARPREGKTLLLVELRGGNDGLNTVIPYTDPAYRALRPNLGIRADKVVPLDAATGLHPSLAPLMTTWNAGQMAITQGVGYPNPNRSHFRSSDIWDSASDANDYESAGWLGRLLARAPGADDRAAEGLVLDEADPGALSAPNARTVVMKNPQQFLRAARRVPSPTDAPASGALGHVLGVERQVKRAEAAIARAVKDRPDLGDAFGRGKLSRRLQLAAELLLADLPVAAIKVGFKGFDTHARQAGTHAALLAELADGLAALRTALQSGGRWDDVLVVTVSEFGRRPRENGSGGTDHGTAAPLFALGGAVQGGLYGTAPSLTDLDGGDLKHCVDFRDVYANIARGHWGFDPGHFGRADFQKLGWI